jgi:predicted RNA-binding Zn ribbon-like protein
MSSVVQEFGEWIDGFLFVANRRILDFLNTRPVLAQGATELLPDFHALERWFIAAGIVTSARAKRLMQSSRNTLEAAAFLEDLLAFRERLRDAVARMEAGSPLSDKFIREMNTRLLQHPSNTVLRKREERIVREPLFDPQQLADMWTPLVDDAATLVSEPETHRLRQCEACVVHFFDTSKKGSRRWCSMNICGNKLKVAAYQRRKRESEAAR